MSIRHKIDWDYVEWLLGELSSQLGPKIDAVRTKREKTRLATAKSRQKDPEETIRKRREYRLVYNEKRKSAASRRRTEIRLADPGRGEGGAE